MKLLALYLSSRGTTVKQVSRVGRATAKFPARRRTWKMTTAHKVGAKPSTKKPATLSAGSRVRVTATPSFLMMRPVSRSWIKRVRVFTARSILAKKAVRAARLVKLCFAMSACWK